MLSYISHVNAYVCVAYANFLCPQGDAGPMEKRKAEKELHEKLNKTLVDMTKLMKMANKIYDGAAAHDDSSRKFKESSDDTLSCLEKCEVLLNDLAFALKYKKLRHDGALTVAGAQALQKECCESCQVLQQSALQLKAILPKKATGSAE